MKPALKLLYCQTRAEWRAWWNRRVTSGWVASAKKEETQRKRLAKLIGYSAKNKRIEFV